MAAIRVLLVDDHALLRAGLRALLEAEPDIEVVGEAATGEEGFTASESGAQLRLSPRTVDTYRQRVMEKLHLHHRSELVRFALRYGLLSGPN